MKKRRDTMELYARNVTIFDKKIVDDFVKNTMMQMKQQQPETARLLQEEVTPITKTSMIGIKIQKNLIKKNI